MKNIEEFYNILNNSTDEKLIEKLIEEVEKEEFNEGEKSLFGMLANIKLMKLHIKNGKKNTTI